MKKAIIFISIVWAIKSNAQVDKQFHFSVVQSISTDGKASKENDYYASFNLLSGTVKSIEGTEIGTLYNQNMGNMTGFQASGLMNNTKGYVNGYQLAGLINFSGNVRGFQNAGLINLAENSQGVQMAGIANTAKKVKGLQLSGIFNRANSLNGYQVGLINVADSVVKGGGIGLLNFYRKGGYRELEISFSDYQNIGLSYKSGVKSLYTIVSVGYNFLEESLYNAGLGIGGTTKLKENWYFKPEIVWYNYITNDLTFNTSTQSTHLKLGIMKKMEKISVSLYPSIYYANIPKGKEGDLTKISPLQPFSSNSKGRYGFGLGIGIGFLN